MIDRETLLKIMPLASKRVDLFLPHINEAMDRFGINRTLRISAFLAQIAHETCQLLYLEELASGVDYEGRKDLGNTMPGDGVRFKGRGLLQITGRFNYEACGKALGIDLIENPKLLLEPEYASLSAGWYWETKGLNKMADDQQFMTITKRINGGLNGIAGRLDYYRRAKTALGIK